jgi:hypothetical protein
VKYGTKECVDRECDVSREFRDGTVFVSHNGMSFSCVATYRDIERATVVYDDWVTAQHRRDDAEKS